MDARPPDEAFKPATLNDPSPGGEAATLSPAMALALTANFASVTAWRSAFAAAALAHGGNPGCLLLLFDPGAGTLHHRWTSDAAQVPAGLVPILGLALPGPASTAQLDAFTAAVAWAPAYERYQHAVHAASEAFGAAQDEVADAVVIDVRRAGVFDQAHTMIPGASWRDPAAVAAWAAELPAERELIVYCVYGHEVGRATALRLRATGLNARFLRGGIDAWQAAERPLQAKGEPS